MKYGLLGHTPRASDSVALGGTEDLHSSTFPLVVVETTHCTSLGYVFWPLKNMLTESFLLPHTLFQSRKAAQ